ncbi:MAG: hypothetical protein K2P99_07205 [Burkholderiales bacterium]|nr:hypothetical protein [Burkholderiales bacterium]
MTKFFKYTIPLFLAVFLFACGNGAIPGVSSTAYGNYQFYSPIKVGGESSSQPIPVTVLQSFTESFASVPVASSNVNGGNANNAQLITIYQPQYSFGGNISIGMTF